MINITIYVLAGIIGIILIGAGLVMAYEAPNPAALNGGLFLVFFGTLALAFASVVANKG